MYNSIIRGGTHVWEYRPSYCRPIDKGWEIQRSPTDPREFHKHNRGNMLAWQLYVETWQTAEDRKRVWGYCLKVNPNSMEAKHALEMLNISQVAPNQPVRQIKKPASYKPKRNWTFTIFSTTAFIFIAAMLGVMYLILSSRPANPAEYRHTSPVEYYLYVPKDYSGDRVWPLFVGIHGSGGSGLDCWNMWQSYAEDEGFILLCPSIPGDSGGYYLDVGERTVWSAVNAVRSEYKTSSRMFMAGFSAGAYFIQGFALHYPNSVSGLAILSSGYYTTGFPIVPVLIVIGGADHPESLQANAELASYLQNRGYDLQYYVLPGVGHWATNETKELTIKLFRKTIGK
jgi:predicted esterase